MSGEKPPLWGRELAGQSGTRTLKGVESVDRLRRTAAGTIVAVSLLGLRDVLDGRPEREEIAIVDDAPAGRVELGFRLVFDEGSGTVTVVLPEPLPDEDFQR